MTLCSPVRWFNPRDKRDRRLLSGKRNFGRVIKGENGQKVVNVLCSESRKLDQLVCAALITTIPSINGRSRFPSKIEILRCWECPVSFFWSEGGGGEEESGCYINLASLQRDRDVFDWPSNNCHLDWLSFTYFTSGV